MKNKTFAALILASAVAFGSQAFAQEPAAAVGAQVGQVTVSSGGSEFRSAASGQPVRAGDRVMLLEGSAVTLNFPNGCSLNLNKPGVYTVPAVCNAGMAAQDVDWRGAAIIAGGVAIVAAGLSQMDDTEAPPCVRRSPNEPPTLRDGTSCPPPESR